MSELEATVPAEPMVSWDMFLVYLTAFGNQGADNALVWEVLGELGLAERNAFTGAEMMAIEKAIMAKLQLKLACSSDERAGKLLNLLNHANRLTERHAAPI